MWEQYISEDALKNPSTIIHTDGTPSPNTPMQHGDLYPKLSQRTTIPCTTPSGEQGKPNYGDLDGFKFSSVGNGVSRGMEAEKRAMKVVNENNYSMYNETGVKNRGFRNAMYKQSEGKAITESIGVTSTGTAVMLNAVHALMNSGNLF